MSVNEILGSAEALGSTEKGGEVEVLHKCCICPQCEIEFRLVNANSDLRGHVT